MFNVSVIIPTYNRGYDIRKSIYSVINQSYKPYEIIVVSDGSNDNTKEVVENIMREYPFISFYEYFPNRGANFARNYGIKKSKGDYIAFLDDDDQWLEKKLEKQMNIFKRYNNIDLVYTGLNNIYLEDNIKYISLPEKYDNISKEILFHNIVSTTSTVCVKKDVLIDVGGFDENLPALQDYELWIRICQKYKIYGIREPLINYYNRRNKSKQISSKTNNYVKAIEYIYIKHKNLYSNFDSELMKRKKTYDNQLLLNKEMRNNNRKQAIRYAIKNIRINKKVKYLIYLFVALLPYKIVLLLRAHQT